MLSEYMLMALACVPQGGEADPAQADTGGILELALSPDQPTTGDDLWVEVTTSENTLDVTAQWFRDNDEVVGLVGLAVPAEETRKGESWRVVLIPDLDSLREPALSAKQLILNTPPVVEEVVLESGDTTQALLAQVSTSDLDEDEIDLSYRWLVDGQELETQVSSSLEAGVAIRDQVVEVHVVPHDGEESGDEMSAVAVISNAAPSIASASIQVDGALLTLTIRGWEDADDDPESHRYAWHVDDEAVSGSMSSLDLDDHPGTRTVYCVVTPDDGTSQGDPVTTGVVVVDP
ncbi:MAG: hypothetical protein GY913_04395 [Proteobacteria bacterium]|nr:hypothetical protein [Pseudomonadota bacterium]MCP4916141.1 hypothetical protein [Pseudomonadota bacterium]